MPKITFVGGKWYNERGQEVPKPQARPRCPECGKTALEGCVHLRADLTFQGQPPVPPPLQRYTRLDGCKCARPDATGHVPGCPWYADALYVCETANRRTIENLAKLAESSIADLERRRHDYVAPEAQHAKLTCPDIVPSDTYRRRCWMCPYWNRHKDETPFDHQKLALEQFPETLKEADDDLPF